MATQNINIVISATGAATVVRSIQSIGSAATNALAPLKLLERQLQAVMSILAIRQITQWADEWMKASNMISVFAKNQSESNAILAKLYTVAQNVRQPLGEIVSLYHKLSIQSRELGVSTKQNIQFTEGIGKALSIQGTEAAAAKGALLQLSQAMGTGRIKAQEYNSLLTGLPLVLLTVAKNMDAAGGSVAKLTQMQRAGQLSSKQFFDAFMKGLPELDAMFEKTQKTFAQGFTVFENGMTKFIGQLNQASGISNGFYEAMKFISENMENIAKAALVVGAGVIAAFAPAILAAFVTGLQAVFGALVRISALLLANPFVLLATAAVAAYAFGDSLDAGIDGMTTLRDLLNAFGEAVADTFSVLGDGISEMWDGVVGWAVSAYEAVTETTVDATSSWTDSYFSFYDNVGNGLAGFLRGVARTFDAIGGLLIGLMIQMFSVVGGIPGAFEQAFNRAYNVVSGIFQDLFNLIIGGINKIRVFMGDDMLPLLQMQKREVDEKYFKNWGGQIAGAIDEGFRVQGGALEKSLDSVFASAQAKSLARAAKAAQDAAGGDLSDPLGTSGGAAKGLNGRDNPALKRMQGQIKQQELLIKEELKMYQERVKALDFLAQNELLTLRDVELAKRDLIQSSLTVTMAAYDKEEAAVRAFLAQAQKRTDIEGANTQLMEIAAKRREAQADATAKLTDSERALLAVQLQFNNATKEAARNGDLAIKNLEFEISLMGKSTIEVQKAMAAKQIELELEQRIYELKKKDPTVDTGPAREEALRRTNALLTTMQEKYDAQRSAVFGITEALRKYTEEAGNLAGQLEGALTNAFKGVEDALVEMTVTGKSDFRSMVDSFIRDLARIPVKQVMSGITSWVSGLFSGAGASGGAGGAASGGSGIMNLLSSAGGGLGGLGGIMGIAGSGFTAGLGATMGGVGTMGGLSAGASLVGTGTMAGATSGLGMMAGAAAPWVMGAIALKSLMDYKVESRGSGLTATLGGANGLPSGSVGMYNEFQQTGGLGGGGTTINRDWSVADQGVADYIKDRVQLITASNTAYANAIGLSSDSITNFTKSIEINISGMDAAAQQAAIDGELANFSAEQITATYGAALAGVARAGETTTQTLQRLGTDIAGVNSMFGTLGYAMFEVSVAGASAASTLVSAFGSLAAMQSQLNSFYQNFYSQGEQEANVYSTVQSELGAAGLNYSVDQLRGANRGDIRGVVDSLSGNVGTAEGAAQYAAAVKAANMLAAIKPAVEATTVATKDLGAAMNGGGGGGGGGGGAVGAANDLTSALQSLTDAMFEEVNRIRGIIPGQGTDGLEAARARLYAADAAANNGDQDAMRAIPQLSQAFLALAENNTGSAAELRLIQAQVAAMIENTDTGIATRNGLNIPAFASGGFHDGGWAMVGEMGPELAYLPPAHIYTAGDTSAMLSGDSGGDTANEISQMRRESKILLGQVASLINRQLKLSQEWDGNGLPQQRATT